METTALAVEIESENVVLQGDLHAPAGAPGIVVFAHGSGSSRRSPRNRQVARYLNERGLGTLLFDLLTPAEERVDAGSGCFRFDIPLLARRLAAVGRWLRDERGPDERIGYFGASTGAAAAIVAAADEPGTISAVVSRGGRPDLAEGALDRIEAPTLLIVGGDDEQVLALNEAALARLRCEKDLTVIPGATHLFPEAGALDKVAYYAAEWFTKHLGREA